MQNIVDLGAGSEGDPLRLLVASIRSADEIAALAAEGCNTFTIAPVRRRGRGSWACMEVRGDGRSGC